MKIFLSLPMKGVPFKEILYNIDCMESKLLKEMHSDPKRFGMVEGDEIQFVSNARGTSHPADDYKYPPLWYLGQAIQRMGDCDYIAFDTDCEKAKGCLAEFEVARIYKIPMIFLRDGSSTMVIDQSPDEHTINVDKKPRVECDAQGKVKVDPQSHYEKAMKQAFDDAEWFFNDMMDYLVHHGMDERQKADCYDMVNAIIDAAVLKMEWKKSILEENK